MAWGRSISHEKGMQPKSNVLTALSLPLLDLILWLYPTFACILGWDKYFQQLRPSAHMDIDSVAICGGAGLRNRKAPFCSTSNSNYSGLLSNYDMFRILWMRQSLWVFPSTLTNSRDDFHITNRSLCTSLGLCTNPWMLALSEFSSTRKPVGRQVELTLLQMTLNLLQG